MALPPVCLKKLPLFYYYRGYFPFEVNNKTGLSISSIRVELTCQSTYQHLLHNNKGATVQVLVKDHMNDLLRNP